jgi:hypothetical protein
MGEIKPGGGAGFEFYANLGLADLFGVEHRIFEEHPVLNHLVDGERAPRSLSEVESFFRLRDFINSPAVGYTECAIRLTEQVEWISTKIKEDRTDTGIPHVLDVQLKPSHMESESQSPDRLYSSNITPASNAFVGLMLQALHAKRIDAYPDHNGSERIVYSGWHYSQVLREEFAPFIVEVRGQDASGEEWQSFELRSKMPINPSAKKVASRSEAEQPADDSEINPNLLLTRKLGELLNFFISKQDTESEIYDEQFLGYDEVAQKTAEILEKYATEDQYSSTYLHLLPLEDKAAPWKEDEYAVVGNELYSTRVYDDEPVAVKALILKTHQLLEDAMVIGELDPKTGDGSVITVGLLGDRTVCFVETTETDKGKTKCKTWRIYPGISEGVLVGSYGKVAMTNKQKKGMLDEYRQDLEDEPTTEEPL